MRFELDHTASYLGECEHRMREFERQSQAYCFGPGSVEQRMIEEISRCDELAKASLSWSDIGVLQDTAEIRLAELEREPIDRYSEIGSQHELISKAMLHCDDYLKYEKSFSYEIAIIEKDLLSNVACGEFCTNVFRGYGAKKFMKTYIHSICRDLMADGIGLAEIDISSSEMPISYHQECIRKLTDTLEPIYEQLQFRDHHQLHLELETSHLNVYPSVWQDYITTVPKWPLPLGNQYDVPAKFTDISDNPARFLINSVHVQNEICFTNHTPPVLPVKSNDSLVVVDISTDNKISVDIRCPSRAYASQGIYLYELEIIEFLGEYAPGLVRAFLGSKDALSGSNIDKSRHIFISLREMWNGLLRTLAPDSEIKNYFSMNDSGYFKGNKPTKRARIEYLFLRYLDGKLTALIPNDIKTITSFVDYLNGVHNASLDLSDDDLEFLIMRSNMLLKLIIFACTPQKNGFIQ